MRPGACPACPWTDPTRHGHGLSLGPLRDSRGSRLFIDHSVDIKMETTFTHPSGPPPSLAAPASPPGTPSAWASGVGSVLGLPDRYPPSDPDLPAVDWAFSVRGRVGGFPSEEAEQGEVGRQVTVVWGLVKPVVGSRALPGMPPALVSGRAGLMSDSCWRLLPLWLNGAPHILWPRAAHPVWPSLGLCQSLQPR